MKYNVVLTVGGVVTNYDGMTEDPIDIDQTDCSSKILSSFDTLEEAGKFLEDYVLGKTDLPYMDENQSVEIVEVED